MGLTLLLKQKEIRQSHSFFSRQNSNYFWLLTRLSFVQTTPLLTLITRHQFLTKNNHTTFHKFTRYVSLPRVTLLLYNYGFAALYQKKPTRVWKTLEASFFPGKHDIVVLYLCEVRRHFGFVFRVSSLTS